MLCPILVNTDILTYSDNGYSYTVWSHLVTVTLFWFPKWPSTYGKKCLDTVIQWHSIEPSGYSDSFWPFPRVSLYVCNLAKKLYISYLRSILMNFASMLVILRLVKIVFFSKDENSSKKPEKAWKSPKPEKAWSPKSPKLQGSGFGP